jgi:flagellar hook-basal body complex protein FliE
MAAPIAPITLANPATITPSPQLFPISGESTRGSSFQSIFQKAVDTVQASSDKADEAIQSFLSGNTEDVHSAVLATQRADLTFELFMQVRNKVVSAYQEIMRMQV